MRTHDDIVVSIIIPVKDETDPYLGDCLDSLRSQDFPRPYEIIVVGKGNRPQARNFGVENAKGGFIAFIDSDCIAPDHWLSKLIRHLEATPGIQGVGGIGISPENTSRIGRVINYVYSTFLGSLNSPSVYSNLKKTSVKFVFGLSAHNSIYYKKALMDAGLFDARFDINEDTSLMHNMIEKGYKVMLIPDGYVYHRRKKNIKEFAQKFYMYGLGRMRSIFTDMKYMSLRRGLNPLIVSLLIISYFIYPLLSIISFMIYLAIISYHALDSYYKEREIEFLLLVPLLFFLQHISYTLGMIIGIFKGKWKIYHEECEIIYHEKIV